MSSNLSLMNEALELSSTDNQLNEESVENTLIEDKDASEELAFSGDVAAANGFPVWEHESRMAFHVLFDASDRDAPDKIPTRVRRPYPGRPALYKKDEHFMKHETRQVLDALMPEGAKYGVVTFEASGKDGCKNMAEMAKYLCRNGWIEGDERYRVVYADVNGTGTMILVSQSTRPFIAGTAKQCRIHPVNDVASVAASLFCIWPPWSANHPPARIPVQQRQGASFRFSVWSWPGPRRIEPFTETKQFRVHRALWAAY
jgi:hypothetical protein